MLRSDIVKNFSFSYLHILKKADFTFVEKVRKLI